MRTVVCDLEHRNSALFDPNNLYRISKWFILGTESDDIELKQSRGYACELVAWQFLTYLSERELIEYLLSELPDGKHQHNESDTESGCSTDRGFDERSPLLGGESSPISPLKPPGRVVPRLSTMAGGPGMSIGMNTQKDPTACFAGMNCLEIAAVADAKKFLSQNVVQKIVHDCWDGHIIFWDPLAVHAKKKPHLYNKRYAHSSGLTLKQMHSTHCFARTSDPYSRLRVPKYQKFFQMAFFGIFLLLYYLMLIERNPAKVTVTEGFLYIWIASFAYDEFGEFFDAG